MLATKAATDFPQIEQFLSMISLLPRQACKHLTLWPLVRSGDPRDTLRYVTLSQAASRGDVLVDELRTGAQVPHALVVNRGEVAVLTLFGEEIRGAKQNRIANASFLVPARGEVVLYVSCVEQGRWSRPHRGVRFSSTGEVISHDMKAKMARRIARSRKVGRSFDAGQLAVWDDVAARVEYSATSSPSGAYADYVSTRARDLDEIGAAFHPVEGQVGFIAMIGEEVVGIEAIGRADVFAAAYQGLVRSYLIDAVDFALVNQRRTEAADAARFGDPESFLAALRETSAQEGPSLGLGSDLRFESERVGGCALVEKELIHLTAFPAAIA